MTDWTMFSDGLPVDASINEIEIYHNPENPEEDAIRAGTYGRGLWSSLMWHGVPEANFEASETTVPVGCEVDFYDLSSGVPTSWEWTFEGGTPNTSNIKNPEGIIYMNEGVYDVTLTVTNEEGSDSETISGYLTVSETATPDVSFMVSDSITCSGMEIQFTDMSSNCPTAWQWSFDPSSVSFINGTNQNSQNPEVEFTSAGSYSVTLAVTNSAGTNSLTKDDYINIGGINLPFSDDFESGDLSAKSWTIENPDFDVTWDIAQIGGAISGNYAARLNFFEYIVPPGPRDRLITPVLNFEGLDHVYMTFKHAYAKRHSSVTDSLIVYISDDCGTNWTRVFEGGEDNDGSFATHEIMTDPFIPAVQEDWCGYGWGADCIFIDLTTWAGQNNVQVAFETYNYFGNNLYIDNVNIGMMTDIAENNIQDEIQIYPNPTNGIINIQVPDDLRNTDISIYNMQGAEILKIETSEGERIYSADLGEYSEGMYLIRVNKANQIYTKKILLK